MALTLLSVRPEEQTRQSNSPIATCVSIASCEEYDENKKMVHFIYLDDAPNINRCVVSNYSYRYDSRQCTCLNLDISIVNWFVFIDFFDRKVNKVLHECYQKKSITHLSAK